MFIVKTAALRKIPACLVAVVLALAVLSCMSTAAQEKARAPKIVFEAKSGTKNALTPRFGQSCKARAKRDLPLLPFLSVSTCLDC
jgi:hypothetical protein